MAPRIFVILGAGAAVLVAGVIVFYTFDRRGSGPEEADLPPAVTEPALPTSETPPEPAPEAPPTRPAVERPAEPATPPRAEDVAPTTGALRIESDVPDTSVFVDRVYLGTAPVTKADLPPGPHTVLLSPTGYDSISQVVDVTAGEERAVSVSFKEIRLDASIAVVHKHTFGSCEGTLKATPAGLSYETSNKNDAFTVSFSDIETFEVDYLNKNLRVKIRRGKTYNFTDPEGNADNLFVFHRDVEEVRQRLAGRRP